MCEWERKVNAYWDNELTNEEAKRVTEHLRTCTECQSALNSLQQIREILLRENLPAMPASIGATLERLRYEGAFRTPKWRQWLLRFDFWLMRPKVAFRVAMAASLLSALILANLSAQISQAAEKVQGSVQTAIRSVSLERIWQRFSSLVREPQGARR